MTPDGLGWRILLLVPSMLSLPRVVGVVAFGIVAWLQPSLDGVRTVHGVLFKDAHRRMHTEVLLA